MKILNVTPQEYLELRHAAKNCEYLNPSNWTVLLDEATWIQSVDEILKQDIPLGNYRLVVRYDLQKIPEATRVTEEIE